MFGIKANLFETTTGISSLVFHRFLAFDLTFASKEHPVLHKESLTGAYRGTSYRRTVISPTSGAFVSPPGQSPWSVRRTLSVGTCGTVLIRHGKYVRWTGLIGARVFEVGINWTLAFHCGDSTTGNVWLHLVGTKFLKKFSRRQIHEY
jgi:hypothetical protein